LTPSARPDPKSDSAAAPGGWQRLRAGLEKTRRVLTADLGELIRGARQIDANLLEEIESRLLQADAGVEATRAIIDGLTAPLSRHELTDLDAVMAALRAQMIGRLERVESPLFIAGVDHRPFVILVIGVNGAGKTTTIAKLAHWFRDTGESVVLAAGDTFRAAAVEQLQHWGARTGAPVIAQKPGADSAAVIWDALESARARNAGIVIADTAGRLHTRHNLMEELRKIRRTIAKFDATLPVETLLVIEAGTGQNALAQLRQFHEAVGVTGLVLTKLDGTARGGVVFALAAEFAIPVRFVGLGEQLDDLRPFAAEPFVDALLAWR
jgi:fused signal recognition particle receptor